MPNPTVAEMKLLIEALKAQLAEKRKTEGSEIKFKISEKGAVSVYGLGRFPVTLYDGQWDRLTSPETLAALNTFRTTHKAHLAVKGVEYVKPVPVEAPAAK